MKSRGSALRQLVVPIVSVCLASCAWDPWIPEESGPPPEIVVDPAKLSRELVLGSPYVDQLDCFDHRCQQRFRVTLDDPGQLTVTTHFELASSDDSARVSLESMTRGVVARGSTGRGPHADAPVVSVTHDAEQPGVYFVLLQSIGGKVPYQIVANFDPAAVAPSAPPAPRAPDPRATEPPARLTTIDSGPMFGAKYDPRVVFRERETFTFAKRPSGPDVAPGTIVDTPTDREIRRYSADVLETKGFRQAYGSEQADFVVGFSTGDASRTWYSFQFPGLYSSYGFSGQNWTGIYGPRVEVAQRDALIVDIVDARTRQLAWHSWTTTGAGPGVIDGAARSNQIRKAVTEVLAKFPPN